MANISWIQDGRNQDAFIKPEVRMWMFFLTPPYSESPLTLTCTKRNTRWDSQIHNIPSKYSVIGTLYHRANTICSTCQYLQDEQKHLDQALKKCKYPSWAINRVRIKTRTTTNQNSNRRTVKSNTAQSSNPNINIVVPYHQGLSENIKRTCKKYGIQVHCKGGHTIKKLLMAPKDKDQILNKSGIIYRYKCHRVECDEEYIGESAMNLLREV